MGAERCWGKLMRAICQPSAMLKARKRMMGEWNDTRFLYELIQNAEDNQYCVWTTPFLNFILYPDKIVIDSNENGFTSLNFKAICSTGESTKTNVQGYVGEKGIGFKSVFKVAKKVHIQSGVFSFSFVYTRDSDDDGLGMVTPLSEPYEDLPANVRTRMTLTLLRPEDFMQRAADLSNLPDTLLLFLSKIRSINVRICSSVNTITTVRYKHVRGSDNLEKILKSTKTYDGTTSIQTKLFLVTRRVIRNLPFDPARKHTNQATIILAFPVDVNDTPILENQHVFAYLPLRRVGFKIIEDNLSSAHDIITSGDPAVDEFLIQSDFITQASREDVFDCPRNETLLDGVAQTFRDAVLGFSNHHMLQYQWMRYLPDGSISDDFWKRLAPKIENLLKEARILRSWTTRLLHSPGKLRYVAPNFRDKDGEPFFADLMQEAYLAPEYEYRDLELLKPLGTKMITLPEIIDRVESDLRRNNSKMKASSTNDDWHTRVANFLARYFNPNRNSRIDIRIKALPLIPLRGGTWTAVGSMAQSIYFPTVGTCNIPSDLDFNIVDSAPIHNTARSRLFSLLGVKECNPEAVISAIYDKHTCRQAMTLIDFSISANHLQFLFWHGPSFSNLSQSFLLVSDAGGGSDHALVDAKNATIYFPDPLDGCGPYQLFTKTLVTPGFAAYFLDARYLRHVPSEARSREMSWEVWLEQVLGIRRAPQINISGKPSAELQYILRYCPDKLLEVLRRNWTEYEPEITNDIETLSSYIPLPNLAELANEFRLLTPIFVHVSLSDLSDELGEPWRFLSRFGVRFTDDVQFYLHLLQDVSESNDNVGGNLDRTFKLYERLMTKCISEEDAEQIRNHFKNSKGVLLPDRLNSPLPSKWVSVEHYVWDGPDWFEVRPRLGKIAHYCALDHLFKTILKTKDAVWQDYLDELRSMKLRQVSNHPKVSEIYRSLWKDLEKDGASELLRSEFEKDKLVYVPQGEAWIAPSMCLWANNKIRIPNRVSVATTYSSLEDFFTKMLDNAHPGAQGPLHSPAAGHRSDKGDYDSDSSLNPSVASLADLRDVDIFPVKFPNGGLRLANSSVDFAIADQKEYYRAFQGRINMLDFSLSEIHATRPFLLSLRLQRRFMSVAVEEKTRVEGGSQDQRLTIELRQKAYALFRAKTRDNDRSLYELLRNVTVSQSAGISKSIRLVQSSEVHTVEQSRASFHLEETGNQLNLFVPTDKRDRELCFLHQLPKQMLHFLSVTDPMALAVLVKIMGCSNLDTLDSLLEVDGIIEVDGVSREDRSVDDLGSIFNRALSFAEDRTRNSAWRDSSMTVPSTPFTPAMTSIPTLGNVHERGENRQRQDSLIGATRISSPMTTNTKAPSYADSSSVPTSTISHATSPPLDSSNENGVPEADKTTFREYVERDIATSQLAKFVTMTAQEHYRNFSLEELRLAHYSRQSRSGNTYGALLDRIITKARAGLLGQVFPRKGQAPLEISDEVATKVFGPRSLGRDRKVGAAGELFAFERLLAMGLPRFDIGNWRSTIRKEVQASHKYHDISPWIGSETSDIVYEDKEGWFQNELRLLGHLDPEDSVSSTATYYLEVKTTTGKFDEPFYMSGAQFKCMKKMTLKTGILASEVYILLRVYNIEGSTPGLLAYLDPHRAKANGSLEFQVDTWSVRPT
ncbi:hypothetical protein B0J12DRAFT_760369 [Macrophomina phaseolina]|uniref:Protein NO VEIN C-terminal domain-containing protein n=1 Tax=Macrophomina phaseolina TaxID=35725 RepID=A0ABQ8G3X6_9PEZI|nr:hypothetical protein B0J12DRAFT_760369 [Macrophomina phaseolina]